MRVRFVAEVHDSRHRRLTATGGDHSTEMAAIKAAFALAATVRSATEPAFIVSFRISGARERQRIGVVNLAGRR